MTITTILILTLIAPLAIGLALAYIITHLLHVGTVPYIGLTDAEFEAAFDLYVETRFQEGR